MIACRLRVGLRSVRQRSKRSPAATTVDASCGVPPKPGFCGPTSGIGGKARAGGIEGGKGARARAGATLLPGRVRDPEHAV